MYMNNHVHSAPQLERKKRIEKKERRITLCKIDILNGLETSLASKNIHL